MWQLRVPQDQRRVALHHPSYIPTARHSAPVLPTPTLIKLWHRPLNILQATRMMNSQRISGMSVKEEEACSRNTIFGSRLSDSECQRQTNQEAQRTRPPSNSLRKQT